MNNVIFTGNLCADPELKKTTAGKDYCKFNIAVSRNDKEKTTDFIPCTAWEQQATFLANYGHKGSRAIVSGRLVTGSYEKDGQKVYTWEVTVQQLELPKSSESAPAATASEPVRADRAQLNASLDRHIEACNDLPF